MAADDGLVKTARRLGIDLTAESALARGGGETGRAPGFATSLDIRRLRIIWDIQRVMAELGPAATPETIARRLCPWSSAESGDLR